MKKPLLSMLSLLLLLCFALSATAAPPIALKVKSVGVKKIKPGQIKKRPENAAIKIMSMTFQTTSAGNWGFVYEVKNPGLVDFPAHQLKYRAVQILRNGTASRIPVVQMTNRKGHPHGIKRTYHSPLYRCSLALKVELEVSYKGKVLDKMTAKIPPMNVKILKAYAFQGRYTAHLKNNTGFATKVTLRTIARLSTGASTPSPGLLSHISDSNSVKGPESIVVIPANSTKKCTGTIVTGGQNPSLSVLFKDERQCIGKGYIVLASKTLTPPTKNDLVKHLKPKEVSKKVKANIPVAAQNGPIKIQLPFQIVDKSLYNYMGVNKTFTVDFDFSDNVDPGTMINSVVEFYLRSYENNNYVDEQRLYGKWENTTGKAHLRWTTSPLNSNFQMVDYGVNNNYLQISISVHSTIKSDKGVLLDGDADGAPGGWPYKHKFYIGK
jgi:hypothetical protein